MLLENTIQRTGFQGWWLDAKLVTLSFTKITVAVLKAVKTESNLAESSKERHG
jgi:hypothetical protein